MTKPISNNRNVLFIFCQEICFFIYFFFSSSDETWINKGIRQLTLRYSGHVKICNNNSCVWWICEIHLCYTKLSIAFVFFLSWPWQVKHKHDFKYISCRLFGSVFHVLNVQISITQLLRTYTQTNITFLCLVMICAAWIWIMCEYPEYWLKK